jgi:GR25 family glycosyltransferase involved in LPS biosynthesis
MWEGFKADYNFFTLLLNSVGKKVSGVSPETLTGTPNLIIFGPFGNTWTRYPGIPKVHFTGENTSPIGHADIQLNLGFKHYDMIKNEYMRFPLWLTEIDWFQADTSRLVNPKPIPLELCTRTNEMSFSQRSKFCSFIVSNPNNPIRNQSFHWLNSYKSVDSGGALYNTIGNELSALPGGGGGELKKTKFMMDYKFALTYENSSSEGYTTEKYLHAKASGAVPIYWGDPKFERDFNLDGCIDARNVKTPDELIALVKACESEEMWKKRASVPALDDYQVELARRTLAELAKRIYTILNVDTRRFPTSIGAKKGSNEAKLGMDAFLYSTVAPSVVATPTPDVPLQTPLIVTYATFKFLGSLQHWLTAAKNQLRALPDMKALVFLGPDVPETSITVLKETYTFAEFEYVPGDWTPPNFSDYWEPMNYAWKIWICNTVVNRESLKGKLILYMDAGAILVRWPREWLTIVQKHGIAYLEDPREENERWCGDSFCTSLSVTDSERSAKQIFAGTMSYVSGHSLAIEFFKEAFLHGQNRDIIVGPRLSGVSADGKSYGHRQDQSILSILARRYPIPLVPLDTVYCHHSMRRTFQTGKCIYFHRGDFKKTIPFLPGIEDAYVINLDRRADRLEAFRKAHPELEDRVNRQPAYDGKTLTLTSELATLFKPNDFFWKKAVMGCAMSHLSLWWKLANEHPDIHNYLIFEDDAQLKPGWEEILEKSMAHIPEDYDVLYLGGILPPNREAFQTVLEPVTKYYSRVKPHSVFGQNPPTTYFHSCAYAYILSRKGAVKILNMMEQKKGYWTSADHMMCSPCDTMNLYFLTPVVAGCFQDSDPAYANSEFNNFSRVDSFDSDLWNNDERFSVPPSFLTDNFSIKSLLTSIYNSGTSLTSAQAPVAPVAPVKYSGPSVINTEGKPTNVRFLTLDRHNLDFSSLYEGNWLCNLFGIKTVCTEKFDESTPPPTDCPVVIMMRPFTADISKILWNWSKMGVQFKLLHLSDELSASELSDPLEVYSFPGCKSVLRTYIRNDFPQGSESKIQIIPIGYHWTTLRDKENPLTDTPASPFREFHWSFYGTNWNGREINMKPLLEAKLISTYNFYSDWKDPDNLSETQYKNILLQSVFVPCPDGMNPDTFRVYEALEAGCIPLIVHTEANDVWFRWISNYIPLLDIKSWDNAVRNMIQLLSKPEMLEIYRTQILKGWIAWSAKLKMQTQAWLLSPSS